MRLDTVTGEAVADWVMPVPWAKPWGPYSSSKLMSPAPAVQLTVAALPATTALTPVGASQMTPPYGVVAVT